MIYILISAQVLPAAEQTDINPNAEITLREVTAETVGPVCDLSGTLTSPKKNYVAPNAFSIAQAHFDSRAWFRAVYAADTPVGFVMIVDDAEKPEYFLWRFMISPAYHGILLRQVGVNRELTCVERN